MVYKTYIKHVKLFRWKPCVGLDAAGSSFALDLVLVFPLGSWKGDLDLVSLTKIGRILKVTWKIDVLIWKYLKVSWKHVAPFFSCFFLLKYTEATGCDTSSWNMVKRHLKNYPCPIFVSQTHSGCGLIFMLEKVEHLEICGKITCINQPLSKPSSKPI